MTRPTNLISGGHMPAGTAKLIVGEPAIGLTATGSTQSDALQLSADVNTVSTTAASTGVKLPRCEKGALIVVNNQGAQTLTVYPYETAGVTVDSTTTASIATSRAALFYGTGVDWIFVYGA
jgi:hypothetical protein